MRIIQITDTHLSPSKTHFNINWQPLADWINWENPDLVVHTGDLTLDGAGTDDDLAFSIGLLNELSVPVLSVPGTHDIGHMQNGAQTVNQRRLVDAGACFRRRRGSCSTAHTAEDHVRA
ncbi:calcineurin-like phosphoesterase family protein [Phyllobacterium bourgognense]|uniref:Calcineurin-like phosphoesterase family protein n=1 Tax=Phyllobacterium bourgognense TaxID=314236 RepID=A0A368YBP2_9HYPH|nr:calcineurin-like phosphoesterase family protein [Phyllobacterium bourgognense]